MSRPTIRSTIQSRRGIRGVMSPRTGVLILFALLPVLASGRGGGRGGGGGGHGSFGHGGHSTHGGHSVHTYPSGNGLSGYNRPSHTYPNSGTGLSGNGRSYNTHKTEVHHHYHYSPPTQVHYGSYSHPVYHGTPPVYVYTYRDSGSRYNDLLTGLALYNLGRMSAHSDHNYYSHAQSYRTNPGENCEFQIVKDNGEYERTKIECQLMSSFIFDAEQQRDQDRNRVVSTNKNTVTTVNVTKVENTSDNGSAVITTSIQNSTTVVDALNAKGPAIQVTPGMSCYMVRSYRGSTIKKLVDCGLLQAYARSSFRNKSSRNVPVMNIVILLCSVVYLII